MLFQILKKDLTKRKSVNFILFLFVTLATVFLASSVNNILVVTSAVDYFMDYAGIPDVSLIANGDSERERISAWLEKEDMVTEWERSSLLLLPDKALFKSAGEEETAISPGSGGLYLGTQDAVHNKVFGRNGREFTLQSGELAMTAGAMENSGLKLGDTVLIRLEGVEKEFVVKQEMKDAAFGSDMMGMIRLIATPEDVAQFSEAGGILDVYYVTTGEVKEFGKALDQQDFTSLLNSVNRSTYGLMYSFDMIMAALLIVIGICLILIAMLVLRFTLVFTLEESYSEIGILKAVGLRGFSIRKIYLVKYLVLVSAGALLGFGFSIPVSSMMIRSVSKNLIMEEGGSNLWCNILCALFVVCLVLLFCYRCTRRLDRISAVAAIRGGDGGERFGKRKGLRLHTKNKLPVAMFLGANDLASHVKRYLVLMITFGICFLLITIPVNTLNTMRSSEMASKFFLNPDSAVYVKKIERRGENNYNTVKGFADGMERLRLELEEGGYEAELTGAAIFFFKFSKDGEAVKNIMAVQQLGANTGYEDYSRGTAPKLADEIAFSEPILEAGGWNIGDRVKTVLNGKEQTFLITGTYSDYMQLGNSARLSPETDTSGESLFDYWSVMVDMDSDQTQEELVRELSAKYPDYEWVSAQTLIDQNVGGIQNSLDAMLLPMTILLCAIIMLITVLMEKLFIVREKGEIAMMKSMGFRNRTIRNWQIMRMFCVVLVSMAAAVPLSFLSNRFVLKPIFGLMGADVTIQVVPWQVYGVYPGILFIGIVAATVFAAGGVRKINIRELNNLE